MKHLFEFLNFALIGFRAWLVLTLFQSSSLSAVILGTLGAIALATTCMAWIEGEPDLSATGFGVGIGHLAVLLFAPVEASNQFLAPFFWVCVSLQCWAKWHLGRRCTVSGPVWVSPITSGPYAIVRHPMTVTELLIGLAFACEHPSFWNCGVLVAFVAIKFAITAWEERFLMRHDDYRNYADTVKWRFIPGVW